MMIIVLLGNFQPQFEEIKEFFSSSRLWYVQASTAKLSVDF